MLMFEKLFEKSQKHFYSLSFFMKSFHLKCLPNEIQAKGHFKGTFGNKSQFKEHLNLNFLNTF